MHSGSKNWASTTYIHTMSFTAVVNLPELLHPLTNIYTTKLHKLHTNALTEHKCVNSASSSGFRYPHAVLTCLTDLIMVLIPVPMIQRAKLKPRENGIIIGLLAVAGA